MDTVDYFAPYSISSNWGDNNNNRSDRFNGAVAYMPKNGEYGAEPYPTVIEVRAHYGPQYVAAYQFIDGKITEIWTFTLADWNAGNNQGNHNVKVADVDFDGYNEVVLGGITIDQDGTILWSTNGTRGTVAGGHGDALHVAAMVPDSNEIYVFQPHEASPPNNVTLVRGSTGEAVWTYSANLGDVGRGVAANVTPLPGFEVWAIGTPMYNIVSGEVITSDVGGIGVSNKAPVNFILYWDGDLLSEFFDGPDNYNSTAAPSITKFNYDAATEQSGLTTLQTLTGTYSNNGTKANPSLIADIFGDWRDEVLVRTSDNNALRIYTTDIPTDNVIYTLMHDPQYRLAANSQNAMYNQPAHLSFYLGEDIRDEVQNMQLPVSNIYYTLNPGQNSGPNPAPNPAPNPVAPTPTPVPTAGPGTGTDTDTPVQTPTPEKPILKSSIVNAEQTKAKLQQALQANQPISFSDVPQSHWAAKAIQAASQLRIVEGKANGAFSGSDQVTRAEFTAMIVRTLGIDTTGGTGSFSDTNGHWADAYISALHRAGVVNGAGNGRFNPNQEITRAEMAAILARVLDMSAPANAAGFSDLSNHWAADSIGQLSRAGIISGMGNGKFAPDDTATRDQSVTIIMRMLNTVLDLGLEL